MARGASLGAHPHPCFPMHHTLQIRRARRTPRLRPHACNDGWITLGQIVVDPETGEESEEYALYLCRRCADDKKSGGPGLYGAPAFIVSLATVFLPHF